MLRDSGIIVGWWILTKSRTDCSSLFLGYYTTSGTTAAEAERRIKQERDGAYGNMCCVLSVPGIAYRNPGMPSKYACQRTGYEHR